MLRMSALLSDYLVLYFSKCLLFLFNLLLVSNWSLPYMLLEIVVYQGYFLPMQSSLFFFSLGWFMLVMPYSGCRIDIGSTLSFCFGLRCLYYFRTQRNGFILKSKSLLSVHILRLFFLISHDNFNFKRLCFYYCIYSLWFFAFVMHWFFFYV